LALASFSAGIIYDAFSWAEVSRDIKEFFHYLVSSGSPFCARAKDFFALFFVFQVRAPGKENFSLIYCGTKLTK
jgi:hypothetical protein